MPEAPDLLVLTRRYLDAVTRFATGDELAAFFHPSAQQTEFPNKLTPKGAVRSLSHLQKTAENSRQALQSQRFEIVRELVCDNTVVLELEWTGIMAVPVGSLEIGDAMKAHFAMFIDYRDGKIMRQHNYDCFEAF